MFSVDLWAIGLGMSLVGGILLMSSRGENMQALLVLCGNSKTQLEDQQNRPRIKCFQ